jgi:DNA processing protein
MRTVTPTDPEYPNKLRSTHAPPAALSVDGGMLALDRHAVAIVGSREPSSRRALDFTYELAARVAARGTIVVSGGARGIDRAAHAGAASTGTTWVVLPCGIDAAFDEEPPNEPFPSELATRIRAGGGGFLSTYEPATRASRPFFHARNTLIVQLVSAVVVVQAAAKSGSVSAGRKALTAGLRVFTFRGPCWDPHFDGCAKLLALGAIEPPSAAALEQALQPPRAAPLPKRGGMVEKKLLTLLDGTARHVDELVDRSALPLGRVVSALLTLALDDVVVEGPSGHFRRKST